MRELTLQEVNERYGGILPPDAVFRSDDEGAPSPSPCLPLRAGPRPRTKPKRRTRSERFAVLNAFVDVSLARLTRAEVNVWLVLFRDTKGDGTARTGQADIARRAGLSVRQVRRALRRLMAKGMVRVIFRGRLNAGPSIYAVQPVDGT